MYYLFYWTYFYVVWTSTAIVLDFLFSKETTNFVISPNRFIKAIIPSLIPREFLIGAITLLEVYCRNNRHFVPLTGSSQTSSAISARVKNILNQWASFYERLFFVFFSLFFDFISFCLFFF